MLVPGLQHCCQEVHREYIFALFPPFAATLGKSLNLSVPRSSVDVLGGWECSLPSAGDHQAFLGLLVAATV